MHKVAFAGLLLFVFVMPWERNVPAPGLGAIGTPIGIVVLLLSLAYVVEHQKISLRKPSLFMLVMVLFISWSALSYFWSVNPTATLARSVTYLQLFGMVWFVWQLCRTQQEHLALLQAYVFGGYFTVTMVLISFLTGTVTGMHLRGGGQRYTFMGGAGGDPNYIAMAVALAIPMAWHLTSSNRNSFLQGLNLFYLPVALFAIGLTGSRGGFITAVVALTIIPLSYWHLTFWRKALLFVTLGVTLYGAFVLLPPSNVDRMLGVTSDIAEENLARRQDIWRAGFELLEQYPMASVIGIGTTGFRYAVEPIIGRVWSPHNTYLSILVDNGFVGLCLFLLMFIVTLVPNLYLKPPLRIFYVVLWSALLVALIPLGLDNQKFLWFVLTLLTTQRAYLLVLPDVPLWRRQGRSLGSATSKALQK